jgi:hypothetical protein
MAMRVPALELPLALVRNVPVLKRAIFGQAGFAWWSVDNIAVLVSFAVLLFPIDELAAEIAVFPAYVRHSYPIRTVHRCVREDAIISFRVNLLPFAPVTSVGEWSFQMLPFRITRCSRSPNP